MRPDRFEQIRRAPVVQEEDPLAEAPERRGPELVASGLALDDVVGEARPHPVDQQVGEQARRLVAQRLDRRRARPEHRRMAQGAADRPEQKAAPADRRGAARGVGRRPRRGEEPHEERELLDGAQRVGPRRPVRARQVVGHGSELALGRLFALGLE